MIPGPAPVTTIQPRSASSLAISVGLGVERIVRRRARRPEHRHLRHVAVRREHRERLAHLGEGGGGDLQVERLGSVADQPERRLEHLPRQLLVGRRCRPTRRAAATNAANESGRPVLMGDRSYGPGSGGARGPGHAESPVPSSASSPRGPGWRPASSSSAPSTERSSPVVAVGNKVIDLVPLPLKNWAVETFGTSDKVGPRRHDAGHPVRRRDRRSGIARRERPARRALAATGVVGLGRRRRRADPPRPDGRQAGADRRRHARVGGGAVVAAPSPRRPRSAGGSALGAHAVATVGATDELSPIEPVPAIPGAGVADRRVVPVAQRRRRVAGGDHRWRRSPAAAPLRRRRRAGRPRRCPPVADRRPAAVLPPNADLDVEGLSAFVTPNADFYRIDTALVVPQVSTDGWRLRIHGMVERSSS